MTETMLTDFEEALLAYVENRASDHQRQILQKRLQSEPALRAQVLGMIADRMSLQASPQVSMRQALQSRQTFLDRLQRERRQRHALARIRSGALAAAALLLVSAISFRILWPASTSVTHSHHLLAMSSTKTTALRSQPPMLAARSMAKQAAVIKRLKGAITESPTGGIAERPGKLVNHPRIGTSAPWTLVIAVKNSAQNRQLKALLAKFARQNRRLKASYQPQRGHHARMATAVEQLSPQHHSMAAAKAIQVPPHPTSPPKQRQIRAVPAGDLLLILQPAQVQMLRARFTVMQLMAPAQSQEKTAAAFGFPLAKLRATKMAVPPTTDMALHKLTRNHATLRRLAKAQAADIPAQAEPFIIEVLPPPQR